MCPTVSNLRENEAFLVSYTPRTHVGIEIQRAMTCSCIVGVVLVDTTGVEGRNNGWEHRPKRFGSMLHAGRAVARPPLHRGELKYMHIHQYVSSFSHEEAVQPGWGGWARLVVVVVFFFSGSANVRWTSIGFQAILQPARRQKRQARWRTII